MMGNSKVAHLIVIVFANLIINRPFIKAQSISTEETGDEKTIEINLNINLSGLNENRNDSEVTPPEIKVQDPKTCCKENKVSRYCLGLCSPVTSPAARTIRGKGLNLCSKYENVIEKCFLNAEMGMLKDTVKPRTLGGFGGHWTRSLGEGRQTDGKSRASARGFLGDIFGSI